MVPSNSDVSGKSSTQINWFAAISQISDALAARASENITLGKTGTLVNIHNHSLSLNTGSVLEFLDGIMDPILLDWTLLFRIAPF